MNFFQLSYYRSYLYSPKTWLHTINSSVKIYLTLGQLVIFPCIMVKYMLVLIFLLLLFINYLNLHKNIKHNIYYILIFFFLALLIHKNHKVIYKKKNKNSIINYLNNFLLEINSVFVNQSDNPIYRIILIVLINILSIKILFLTTQKEKIFSIFSKISKNLKSKNIQEIIFSLVLASHFLEIISIQIKNLYISYKIRGNCKKYYGTVNNFLFFCLFLIKNFLQTFNIKIIYISYALKSKNITIRNLYLLNSYK